MSAENVPSTIAKADLKFEAVVIPVSDVDCAKKFYANLGWRLDADFPFDNGFRVIQFTPPGSGCSVQFGTKITPANPGSAHGLYLIVTNIETARNQLVDQAPTSAQSSTPPRPALSFSPAHRSRHRPRAQSRQLQLLRHLQRSRRQHLAAPGSHHQAPGPRQLCHHFIRLHSRFGRRTSPR